MRNSLVIVSTLFLLLCSAYTKADEIKKNKSKNSKIIRIVGNERDTTIIRRDTVFVSNKERNISVSSVKLKKADTAYIDASSFVAVAMVDENYRKQNKNEGEGGDDSDLFDDEYGENTISANNISAIPASEVYGIWSNASVNPYKVDLKSIKDSVKFDMSGFVYPLVKPFYVTSRYGPRHGRFHYGIDLKLYVGDTLVAPLDGVVRMSRDKFVRRKGYGKYMVIRHNNGLETVYGHLSDILVEENQRVKAGDVIALGGNTGHSTGSHLHWEFRYLGHPINPEDIIDFESHKPKSNEFLLVKKIAFKAAVEVRAARYWTVRKNDTLGRIATRTGTSVNKLCKLNSLNRKSVLRVGMRIRYN